MCSRAVITKLPMNVIVIAFIVVYIVFWTVCRI